MNDFGVLEKEEVRNYWPHEALDFTRWLAQEKHLADLGRAIGLSTLEIIQTEMPVGPYSADILAKNAAGERVVIENQFGKTNHGHLGKLLTYTSVLDAKTLIWVAEEFTEEHQRAVAWLNDQTYDDFAFYAVKLEVWKIDDSRPAYNFKVLVRPASVKAGAVVNRATSSENGLKREKFWQLFNQHLQEKKLSVKPFKIADKINRKVITSDGRLVLRCSIAMRDNSARISVRINKKNAKYDFEQLYLQKDSIEKELGERIEWNKEALHHSMIMLRRSCDFANDDSFKECADWFAEKSSDFIRVFKERVSEFAANPGRNIEDASDLDDDDE